ncbi:hypothetical protein G9P44_000689 [Scheffersomyces stipitis]|nr:hypothetical protein G9P44_000689 [Scheffersomyces stipitis]
MSQEHKDAIAANLKAFDTRMATKYDTLEPVNALSILSTKTLLEFDVNKPRKTTEESAPLLGNPSKPLVGFTLDDLPELTTFREKFPDSVFRPGMKLLDFACGTGLVTMKLPPYLAEKGKTTEIVGIDINPKLLSIFNDKAEKHISEEVSIKSYIYDILDPELQLELSAKFGGKFDAIICTISYHHIDSYREVTKKLAEFLAPGGWLFIVDFYNEDVEKDIPAEKAGNAVRHMGGLKVDALNETLGSFSGLTNVSAAREFCVKLWQPDIFIENHSRQDIVDKMKSGDLESKNVNGDITYLVDNSIIIAVGQKS